jgi:hypothetical protein
MKRAAGSSSSPHALVGGGTAGGALGAAVRVVATTPTLCWPKA